MCKGAHKSAHIQQYKGVRQDTSTNTSRTNSGRQLLG
jgi:hypothetical protein